MGKVVEMRRRYGGRKLPYDAEVEYLESRNGAYIDTNIILTSDHIVDVTFTNSNKQRIIGARNSSYASFGTYGDYDGYIDLNANHTDINNGRLKISLIVGNIYKAHIENGNRYFADNNNTIIASNRYIVSFFSTGYFTPIFGLRWNSETVTPADCRIHHLSIGLYNEKILNLIPVRKGNVGYMYDKVSGQLFGNSGTGEFILGPDV